MTYHDSVQIAAMSQRPALACMWRGGKASGPEDGKRRRFQPSPNAARAEAGVGVTTEREILRLATR